MCFSTPQCSHWSHPCDLRDRSVAPLARSLPWAWSAGPGQAELCSPFPGRAEPPGLSQRPRKGRRSPAQAEALPVLPLPCKLPTFFHLFPAPCTSSPYATVTSRSLHCPPCQPPTWGTPGTGRGSRGQCWKKRRPAEPGVRCCSCQGLSLTHLTLFLLCPHQRDLAQAWGGGAPGG